MNATVKIKNTIFGEGIPKICIPLTDTNLEELKKSIKAIKKIPHDFVEWRADFYNNIDISEVRTQAMTFLSAQFEDTPILFTIRTKAEGGKLDISTEDYIKLNRSVINSGLMDLLDIELSQGEQTMTTLVAEAHQSGMYVIGSLHDNFSTPPKDQMIQSLCRMQQLGADIVKLAATPQTSRDVLTLLDATLTMQEEHAETPFITISMGRQGMVSRVCGSVFGSSVTFGTAGKASAPGQLPADLLSTFLYTLKINGLN